MIGKIQRIKDAASRDIRAFLRALYDCDIPKPGSEWKMGNVKGAGGDSLTIWSDGKWKDFATGESGDLIDLAQAAWGCTKETLYDRLETMLGIDNVDFRHPHPVDRQDDRLETIEIDKQMEDLSFQSSIFFEEAMGKVLPISKVDSKSPAFQVPTAISQVEDLPPWIPAPESDPWSTGAIRGPSKTLSYVWPYHNKEGEIQFWVGRFEHASGKRFSVAYYSKQGWINKKPKLESFPLLDIHHFWRLKDTDLDTIVVLVEGEKAATLGNKLGLSGFWFTTWHGGAAGTRKQDFMTLKDRRILLWPDNDQPGKEAMQGIYSVLHGNAFMHLLDIPKDWAIKDDVVDIIDRFGSEYVHAFLINGSTKITDDIKHDIPDEHREPNQLGSMYRLIDKFGSNLKSSIERQSNGADGWYVFKDGWWQNDKGGVEIYGYIRKVVETIWQDCIANDPKRIELYANAAKNHRHMVGIMEGASTLPDVAVSENDFDPSPDHIAVANGLLDLRTGELTPLKREHLVSKIIPFPYDKEAKAPKFMEFMYQIMMGDKGLVTFLQDYFGYALTGNPPDRIFPIFHGSGKNGKSTLINIIAAVMGDYHVAARTESIMASDKPDKIGEDIIPLRGARLATLQESERGQKINEAKIKALTGRDRLRCRYLHSNTWLEWTNTAKLILSTNYRPKISGTDKGIWDRVALVPFSFRVGSGLDDSDLTRKIIQTEAGGVLAWMVEGAIRYYKNGKKIIRPGQVVEHTKSYHDDENIMGSFCDEALAFGPHLRIGASELYLLYKRWMDSRGDTGIKSSRNFKEEIGPYLEDLQVKRSDRSSSGFSYIGVGKMENWVHERFDGLEYQDTDVEY
jgi:putative DNA primase/helicase